MRDEQDRRKVLVELMPFDEEKHAPLFASALDVLEERAVVERFERALYQRMHNDVFGS